MPGSNLLATYLAIHLASPQIVDRLPQGAGTTPSTGLGSDAIAYWANCPSDEADGTKGSLGGPGWGSGLS